MYVELGKQRIQLTTARPLGDKTPLPNRFAHALFQTPLGGTTKLSKLVPHRDGAGDGGTPDSAQRPSSMRKHPKHPRNSGKFETPMNSGRHWDVSDGEIAVQEVLPPATIVEDEGDLDEVEYGHPNTLGALGLVSSSVRWLTARFVDLPYRPPFDFELPDYAQVGKTLFGLAHAPRHDEVQVPDFEVMRLDSPTWDSMPLPELGLSMSAPLLVLPKSDLLHRIRRSILPRAQGIIRTSPRESEAGEHGSQRPAPILDRARAARTSIALRFPYHPFGLGCIDALQPQSHCADAARGCVASDAHAFRCYGQTPTHYSQS